MKNAKPLPRQILPLGGEWERLMRHAPSPYVRVTLVSESTGRCEEGFFEPADMRWASHWRLDDEQLAHRAAAEAEMRNRLSPKTIGAVAAGAMSRIAEGREEPNS